MTTYAAEFGKIGISAISQDSPQWFAGWYKLCHIKSGLAFPLVFEKSQDAAAAARDLDAICDWDQYAIAFDKPEFEDRLERIKRSLLGIASDNRGALLPGDPLNHQQLALARRHDGETEAEDAA